MDISIIPLPHQELLLFLLVAILLRFLLLVAVAVAGKATLEGVLVV
jgi:hypothetical protein